MLVYKPRELPVPLSINPANGAIYYSTQPQAQSPMAILLGAGIILVGALALGNLFDSRPPRRTYRRPNHQPLSAADREYVSERDGWRCTYCAKRVTRRTRHIDHSVSRINGGTNHLNNLRLSCAPCNLRKGGMNARQFYGA